MPKDPRLFRLAAILHVGLLLGTNPIWAGPKIKQFNVNSEFKYINPGFKDNKKAYRFQLEKIQARLLDAERSGRNMTLSNQIAIEASWLINATMDYPRIEQRLKALEESLQPGASQEDAQSKGDGMWGRGYTEPFFRMVESYEHIVNLADKGQLPEYPALFMDRFNSPEALTRHLEYLLTSDIRKEKVRKRTELNDTITVFLKLIPRNLPANYPYHPGLKQALYDFIDHRWQDSQTGFWGAWYQAGKQLAKTDDLSLTFHIISYRKGQVSHWPEIIQTTLAMKSESYPFGWLEEGERTTHHLMDAATILRYGWPHMTDAQKQETRKEMRKALDWCLAKALQPDGSFKMSLADDSDADAMFFGVAFLTRVGYLDSEWRFWTDEAFPGAQEVRERIRKHLEAIPDREMGYEDALDLLGPKP